MPPMSDTTESHRQHTHTWTIRSVRVNWFSYRRGAGSVMKFSNALHGQDVERRWEGTRLTMFGLLESWSVPNMREASQTMVGWWKKMRCDHGCRHVCKNKTSSWFEWQNRSDSSLRMEVLWDICTFDHLWEGRAIFASIWYVCKLL